MGREGGRARACICECARACARDEGRGRLGDRLRALARPSTPAALEMGTDAVLELSKQAWDERCEAERALPEAPLWSLETPRERPRQPKPPTRPASARGPRTQKAAAPSRARAAEDAADAAGTPGPGQP